MVNPHVAFQRQAAFLRAHGVTRESDLQYIVYPQNWSRALAASVGADTGASASQSFPANCTLVIGITGACTPTGQPTNPFLAGNERYRISFQYNANSLGLVTAPSSQGGLAQTIFGQYGDQFPARELALEANDTVQQLVQNITPDAITGTISYHCLIWKYAQ